MTFAYPLVLLLPLLALLRFLIRPRRSAAVLCASAPLLKSAGRSLKLAIRAPLLGLLTIAAVALLAIAGARPQTHEYLDQPADSRNIMLTLDLSGSMGTPDFVSGYGSVSRLEAVKSVVSEFIQNRPNDRLGLVVFGTSAFLQSPLTVDHSLLTEMVRRLQVGIAGEDTAIGDGLGLSLKRMQELEGSSKAVILLTDGVNRAGQINPIKAAGIAKDLGIKIHTIGIGAKTAARQTKYGLRMGNVQSAEFDEATLKRIAEISGGVYFNASTIEGLKDVYREIDKLEKSQADQPKKHIVYEHYPAFLLAALLCYALLVILNRSIFLKVP